jgi:alpha-L-rhamnosidase
MNIKISSVIVFFLFCIVGVNAQKLPPIFGKDFNGKTADDNRVRKYISAQRIVWQSDQTGKYISGGKNLLNNGNGQPELPQRNLCSLKSDAVVKPAIVLDFGIELHGGIQIITGIMKTHDPVRVRIRFGESVSEAMSNVDTIKGATNDHSMRDFIVALPWLGNLEVGNSGFRFVRIDLVDNNTELFLKEVKAIFVYRDLEYKGSFECDDPKLNKIWMTGAYTVHLNMQEYIWDGIKRDRLVWVGDMYPEVMTVNSVFGNNDVIPRSLDVAKEQNPIPAWMNTISAYSMWWVLLQKQWYYYQGDKKYLAEQKEYLLDLLKFLISKVDSNGKEKLDGTRFLDWPSSENPEAIHLGYQALMIMTMKTGNELCTTLSEPKMAEECLQMEKKMRNYPLTPIQNKQAAALMVLAGLIDPVKANNEILSIGDAKNFSTFYGYFMLQAMAKAGNYQQCMDIIKQFWGGMLDMGATTFWEDFNLDWLENASPIDELVPPDKKDIHGDYGAYCYKGLRHSLCHGWASGPTAWLTEYVLGVSVVEPGCKIIRIKPNLGNLNWVKGTFPTPYGIVKITNSKLANGTVKTEYTAPKEVKVLIE